jgi:DNA-binding NtrC family response regulator
MTRDDLPPRKEQSVASQVSVLVVSARLENKKALLRILNNLPVEVFTVGSHAQAREVLAQRPISIVFCEERVTDGGYLDLLAHTLTRHESVQFIVMLFAGEWTHYAEALRFGATEVVRCPLLPTDVELALIHAMRKQPRTMPMDASAASA